mmetsp:Transcript_7488/g.15583  ORF Transcript_7488/g.15583 Transcript_7488/m.15583 type:complete len:442 (+) Transcript_7488:886-2211(+)
MILTEVQEFHEEVSVLIAKPVFEDPARYYPAYEFPGRSHLIPASLRKQVQSNVPCSMLPGSLGCRNAGEQVEILAGDAVLGTSVLVLLWSLMRLKEPLAPKALAKYLPPPHLLEVEQGVQEGRVLEREPHQRSELNPVVLLRREQLGDQVAQVLVGFEVPVDGLEESWEHPRVHKVLGLHIRLLRQALHEEVDHLVVLHATNLTRPDDVPREADAPRVLSIVRWQARELLLVAMGQYYECRHLDSVVVKDLEAAIYAVVIPLLLGSIIVVPSLYHLMVRAVQVLNHLLSDSPLVAVGGEAAAGGGVGEGADGEAAAGAVYDKLLRLSHADHRLPATHVLLLLLLRGGSGTTELAAVLLLDFGFFLSHNVGNHIIRRSQVPLLDPVFFTLETEARDVHYSSTNKPGGVSLLIDLVRPAITCEPVVVCYRTHGSVLGAKGNPN